MLDKNRYVALETTPEEFTYDGVKIKKDYLKNVDFNQYKPENWDNLIPDRLAPNDNRVPTVVANVKLLGNQLSKGKHHESYIIGYRIYRASSNNDFERIASIKGANTVTHTVNNNGAFSYYVTAVDTGGREVRTSLIVHTDSWQLQDDDDSTNNDEQNHDIDDEEPIIDDEEERTDHSLESFINKIDYLKRNNSLMRKTFYARVGIEGFCYHISLPLLISRQLVSQVPKL